MYIVCITSPVTSSHFDFVKRATYQFIYDIQIIDVRYKLVSYQSATIERNKKEEKKAKLPLDIVKGLLSIILL